MSTEINNLLEMRNISKTFPGVKALQNVDITLKAGEVLALCGENGAGKSTLMKILSGLFPPDSDESKIIYNGKEVKFKHPIEAKDNGIIMVFQELSLVMDISIAENIYMGALPKRNGLIDWKTLYNNASKVLHELNYDMDPKTPVLHLSIAQRQMVEIARGIALGAKILVLDEPTSSLTNKEKDILFANIHKMKANGVGIIYISHKMEEISEICDSVLVLRDGKLSGSFDNSDRKLNIDDVISCMIGRSLTTYFVKNKALPGEEVIRLEGLTRKGQYQDISFNVRRGEVVGLYGLVGAGRTEIIQSIFGITKPDDGKIIYMNQDVSIKSSTQAVKLKIGYVPENRKEEGLVLQQTCRENISLAILPYINKFGFVDDSKTYSIYNEYKDKLSISSPSSEQYVYNLSGGNQQKIVLGKWLATKPDLLILDEPTRGIDIGAKSDIHELIAKLAEEGLAVIIISSEMPEIIGVSNRLVVIREGKKVAELTGKDISGEKIINAVMFGAG